MVVLLRPCLLLAGVEGAALANLQSLPDFRIAQPRFPQSLRMAHGLHRQGRTAQRRRTVIVTKGGENVKNVSHHSISIHFIFFLGSRSLQCLQFLQELVRILKNAIACEKRKEQSIPTNHE